MTEQSEFKRRKSEDIVEGEVVSELIDDTLMNLPEASRDSHPSIEAPRIESDIPDAGRRQFITRLAIGGVAALALGGSAAMLLNRRDQPGVVILPNGSSVDGANSFNAAQLVTQLGDLQTQLSQVTGERDQLRTQVDDLTSQLEQVKPLLNEAQALNALWRSLDEIGLDNLVVTALTTLGGLISAVVAISDILQPGLNTAKAAVDYVTNNFSGPQSGIRWLGSQVTLLSKTLDDLARSFEAAVQPIQPYAQLVTNFVEWVLNQLPFNIGSKARSGMQGMESIISGLPDLVSGIASDVLDPLAVWFGSDPLQNLTGVLLAPVLDKVIIPAQDMVNNVVSLNQSFEGDVNKPATDAVQRRAEIRKQIQELEAGLVPLRRSNGTL